jgi:hypothetical protein
VRALTVLLGVCVVGLVVYIAMGRGTAPAPAPVTALKPEVKSDPIARGKYLVTAMACGDCHTPHDQTGQPIKALELSGHPEKAPLPSWEPEMLSKGAVATMAPTLTAFAGPFGVSVAPNLTPDPETGLVVSVEGLIASWKSGNHWKYNRPVQPPMPIEHYKELEETDVRAIYAYLQSLPPVKNMAPATTVAPPPAGAPKPSSK